jgi:ketol-acid reductoisomerase
MDVVESVELFMPTIVNESKKKENMANFNLCNAIDLKLLNPLLINKTMVEMWSELINTFELKDLKLFIIYDKKINNAR